MFGIALAAADFDGNGFTDLAIGAMGDHVGTLNAGAVNVLYGSPVGLSASGDQLWSQDSPGVADVAEVEDRFGHALTAGDFNGDGFADLAVGVDGENLGSIVDAGAAAVLYGGTAGLSATGNQSWTQDSPGIEDNAEATDGFGWALTAADLNGDGFKDLAVGVPEEDVDSVDRAGAVNVLYGSVGGLSDVGNQFWNQDSPGIEETADQSDFFGYALTAADFSGDGFADVAIGVPQEFVDTRKGGQSSGAISVIYGSVQGLSASGNQFWSQDTPGIEGKGRPAEKFGSALSAR